MRILWLSNAILTDRDLTGSGTWLGPMANGLVASGDMSLGNIVCAPVAKAYQNDCGPISQWILPLTTLSNRDGLPKPEIVRQVIDLVHQFSPDLIHVWGVETFWGLLTARKLVSPRVILEMQGLKGAYARVYNGGLDAAEQGQCTGFREIVKQATIAQEARRFAAWGRFENEMIRTHTNIATQSEWMEAQVRAVHPDCCTFHTDLVLRPKFTAVTPWQPHDSHAVFYMAAYPAPYKGLHVAIRALAHLRKRVPDATLRIAGDTGFSGFRKIGYAHWLRKLVARLGLEDAVEWLGPLSSDAIIAQMQRCGMMVIPSFAENCCTAMQEAMMVGIPVVASYAGGLPDLAKVDDSALFFPPGDDVVCAWQLGRVLADQQLAGRLSCNSRAIALERNKTSRIIARQLDIYRHVIKEGHFSE
jgi:glycosyltransferase involved in cell wall biosynthesis